MAPKKRERKEAGGGGAGPSSPPAVKKKRSRHLDREDREGRKMQIALEAALESVVPQMVEKVVTKVLTSFFSRAPSFCNTVVDENCPLRYKLNFMNGLATKIFTRKIICDRHEEPLKICMTAIHQEEIDPQILSAKIRVVVLDGDFNRHNQECWTREEFGKSIVRPRDRVAALLTGDPEISLANGEANLCGFTFLDNSKFMRSGMFRLGVMVVDNLGEGVLEGITEPFIVKDRRGEGSEKHDIPLLNDDVWRLNKISKNVASHVGHAKKCCPGIELYSFLVEGKSVNSVCQIVGAKFGDNYTCFDDLEKHKKDLVVKWSKIAYKNMTYDQHDYEMDNGKPRLINQDMLPGLSIVEHECTDPMQGHSAEASGNVCLPDNQLVISGSCSKQHESMRLESAGLAQNEEQPHPDGVVQEEAPLPHLDEHEKEAAPLEEQQEHLDELEEEEAPLPHLDEQEQEAAPLEEQQEHLDELEEQQEHLDELEEEEASLQDQQDQGNLEQAVAWLLVENARVAACAMDIEAQYVRVDGENSVLRARAAELGDRLQSVNEVLRVIQEFSGVAMDIQEEPQEEDNQQLEPWQLLCLAAIMPNSSTAHMLDHDQ